MHTDLYIAIGQIILPQYTVDDKASRAAWLKAGKFLWKIYVGQASAEQLPHEIADQITTYTHGGAPAQLILDRGYSNLVIGLADRNFVLNFMDDAMRKILIKFGHDNLAIHSLVTENNREDNVKILLNAVLQHLPNPVPSLAVLAAKVVQKNKGSFVKDLANPAMPDCLFFRFPKIEVNENRFFKVRLKELLESYVPDALEVKVCSRILDILSTKNNLIEKIHELVEFINQGLKLYSKCMYREIYSPMMAAVEQVKNNIITEAEFYDLAQKTVATYQPETMEGTYIQKLGAILASPTAAKDLHAFLADKSIKSKTSDSLSARLRQPLIELLKEYNQFVKEKRCYFARPQ